ncbi:MSCRAMM family protein [Aedoeadaptatus urinae]|uniref:MSCRAMM family protein n=1 Tax=Aedoeadaptatus urinae TaxID=1871017 RepID=UPI00097CE9BF|nr:SpaA isopeptide-forming pilin-related protein [Peptoniphilus urinae]
MNRKRTALLLAMTFILSTVVPAAATAQTGKAGSGKTAAVSVEKPRKEKSKFAAFVEKLFGVKDAKDDKEEKTLKKTTPAKTDSGSNNGSNGESGRTPVGSPPAEGNSAQTMNSDPVKFDISFIVRDGHGNNLSGAKLKILKGDEKVGEPWDSEKNPKEFSLEPGVYKLEMTEALKGYKKVDPIKFEVTSDGKIKVNNEDLKQENGKNVLVMTVEKEPEKEKSNIYFGLFDSEDNKITGAKLTITREGDDPQEVKIGEAVTISELKAGKYKFTAIVPDGYRLEKESIEFEITDKGEFKLEKEADKAHLKNNDDGTQTLFLLANKLSDFLFFSLKDSNGKSIEGIELRITGDNGYDKKLFSGQNPIGINFSELPDGNYVFSQTNERYGYEKAEPIHFTIEKKKITFASSGLMFVDKCQVLTLVSKSTSNTKARYDVSFSKVDAAGKAFPGTVVELYKDGKVINFWSSGTEAKTINLESGVYRYHEKLNPEGHKAAADFEFEVKADGTISLSNVQAGENVKLKEGRAIVVGEPGSVPAQDPNKKPEQKPGQNNQQKPGQTNPNDKKAGTENTWVEFSLTKRSGGELSGIIAEIYQGSTMVESWTSTDLSYLTRLQPGTYRFHVKTVPTGFAAPKDFEFTVNKDGSITLGTIPAGETVTVKGGLITVIFETKAAAAAIAGGTTAQGGTKSNLPKTGDGISPVVYAAAIGVIGAVTLGIGLKKRKEGIDEAK